MSRLAFVMPAFNGRGRSALNGSARRRRRSIGRHSPRDAIHPARGSNRPSQRGRGGRVGGAGTDGGAAAPGVAEAAGRVLGERYPGFTLAGTHAGSADPGSDLDTTQAVRSSGAQLLFLAYGAAAEEAWLARNLPGSGAIIGMGVGGTFD